MEKKIENKIKKYLEDHGIYYFKHHGNKFSTVGVPDIIACYKGYFLAFEVKAPKGKTSKLQDYHIAKIKRSGGIAAVVKSLEEVEDIIDKII